MAAEQLAGQVQSSLDALRGMQEASSAYTTVREQAREGISQYLAQVTEYLNTPTTGQRIRQLFPKENNFGSIYPQEVFTENGLMLASSTKTRSDMIDSRYNQDRYSVGVLLSYVSGAPTLNITTSDVWLKHFPSPSYGIGPRAHRRYHEIIQSQRKSEEDTWTACMKARFPESTMPWKRLNRPTKQIEVADFLQYPALFPILVAGINKLAGGTLEQTLTATETMRTSFASHILEETTGIAGVQIQGEGPAGQYTEEQIRALVDDAVARNPRIIRLEQEGVSRTELASLVRAIIEQDQPTERRDGYQDEVDVEAAYAILQEAAGGNPAAQQAVDEFIQRKIIRARNPEFILRSALKIVAGFVPGAQGIVAVLEVINDWLGTGAN